MQPHETTMCMVFNPAMAGLPYGTGNDFLNAEISRGFKDMAGSFAYFVKAIPAAFDMPVHHIRARAPKLN